ncbi:MAG: polymer-forming cytoskeletal protein [Nitrospinales bacterium]
MIGKKPDDQLKAYLGEGSVFHGNLNFQGMVRIDGTFEGEVMTNDTLIVGETGRLTAEVTAGTVICKGKIKGKIQASSRVEIHDKSEIVGSIKTPTLYIEVGAIFDGSCDMTGGEGKIIKLVKGESKLPGNPI